MILIFWFSHCARADSLILYMMERYSIILLFRHEEEKEKEISINNLYREKERGVCIRNKNVTDLKSRLRRPTFLDRRF